MLAARLDGRSESSSGSDPAWHAQSARNELSRGRICRGSRRGHEKPRRPDTRDAGSAAAHARAQLPTAAARRFKTVWESGRYRRLEDLDDAPHRATSKLSTAGDCSSRAASLPVLPQTVGLAASIPARVRRDGRCSRLEPNPKRRPGGRREAQRTRRTCPAFSAGGSFAFDEVVAIFAVVTAVDARLRFAPLSPSTVAGTASAFAFFSAAASPAGERAAPRRSAVRCGFLPISVGFRFFFGFWAPPVFFKLVPPPRGLQPTPVSASIPNPTTFVLALAPLRHDPKVKAVSPLRKAPAVLLCV